MISTNIQADLDKLATDRARRVIAVEGNTDAMRSYFVAEFGLERARFYAGEGNRDAYPAMLGCAHAVLGDLLEIIDRQAAEITRLTDGPRDLGRDYDSHKVADNGL